MRWGCMARRVPRTARGAWVGRPPLGGSSREVFLVSIQNMLKKVNMHRKYRLRAFRRCFRYCEQSFSTHELHLSFVGSGYIVSYTRMNDRPPPTAPQQASSTAPGRLDFEIPADHGHVGDQPPHTATDRHVRRSNERSQLAREDAPHDSFSAQTLDVPHGAETLMLSRRAKVSPPESERTLIWHDHS